MFSKGNLQEISIYLMFCVCVPPVMMERRVLGRNLKKEENESTTPVVPIGPLPSTPLVSSSVTSHPPEEALASYLSFSLIKSLGSLITFISVCDK
jgi:hypothetical protein